MKNIQKFLLILLFVSFTIGVNAQTKPKFGHVDSQELLKLMPGKDSAKVQLDAFRKELEDQLVAMQSELETKYNQYLEARPNLTPLIKQVREKEIQDLQARIEQFQTDATNLYQEKEESLLQPIIDKAKKAIEKVAKENKYTYVFDSGVGVLLYKEDSDDILPLVKKELGIE
ncbi:MAG: OmpH family outer membrane protein [Saprospiraceae bacterium]|nr:OmpH family outer membrane protein [Saprospiraceae bacterium]